LRQTQSYRGQKLARGKGLREAAGGPGRCGLLAEDGQHTRCRIATPDRRETGRRQVGDDEIGRRGRGDLGRGFDHDEAGAFEDAPHGKIHCGGIIVIRGLGYRETGAFEHAPRGKLKRDVEFDEVNRGHRPDPTRAVRTGAYLASTRSDAN